MGIRNGILGTASLATVFFLLSPEPICSQSPNLQLTRVDQAALDSLALKAAQRIRSANLDEKEPKVVVFDFFRNAPGNYPRLGTLLANRFAESLGAFATGFKVLDREVLKDYLIENWTTLEDLQSSDVCFRIGRQLGATVVILGTLHEENGQLSLTTNLEGFGPPPQHSRDELDPGESIRILLTSEIHFLLLQPGPDYSRKPDEIPEEPGVSTYGVPGVTPPRCVWCPTPAYSDAARAAQFQGTVRLSIVVTPQGEATAIYVLKGAPFGMIAKTIETVKTWRFAPAQKDGQPLATRLPVETTFRLY